jgi:hypothetical protein
MKFHIHALPEEPGCPHSSVIALRLESCLARRGDIRLLDKIAGDWAETQRDFVNSLYSPDVDRTFALRFIARPDSAMVSAGRVDVVLLGKSGAKTAKQSRTAATDLGCELVALLCTHMPDYQWLPVTESEEFASLWNPFDSGKIQIAALRRRESMVSIQSLKSRPSLGRGRTATVLPEADAKSALYCVHPFAPRFTTFPGLMRMLLLQGGPVLFQTALRPTRLEQGEKQALHEQIGRCEHALGSNHAGNPLQPAIHRNRTSSLCRLLLGQAMRVEDAPFLHHAMLASRQPLTAGMMESAGIAITRPLGGDSADTNLEHATDALQTGGYDTARPAGDKDRTAAEKNLWNLDFDSWGPTLAPPSLVRLRHLLDASEAISSFQIPLATEEGLQGIEVRSARFRPMPPELASKPPAGAISPGFNPALGQLQPVRLSEAGRRLHTYVVGQTGTGKSTLLSSMIIEDMRAGRGLAVIDPHGDLYHELLRHVPPSREKDLVLLDPSDPERVPGLNLMECASETERHFVVREAREIIEKLVSDQYGNKSPDYMGPAFFQHMQMNMLLAMSNPERPGTLLDFYQIFQRKDHWKRWMPLRWRDPRLVSWVENNLPSIDYLKRGGDNNATWGEYLSAKFEDFVFDPLLRNIFGQQRSTIRMREIMDQGKILLVNLSKGQLAEQNARFLGYVLMARIKAAAMARADVPISKRRLFFLYVDEFQSLATSNFIPMLSESRKYGLSLVLANQFVSQISDDRIMNGIFGNVGTHVCFRVGRDDAEKLEPQFGPSFDRADLANLPNWHACVRTTVDGRVTAPFTLRTNPLSPTESDPERVAKMVDAAKAACTRPRAEVEQEILASTARLGPMPDDSEKPVQLIIVEKDPVVLGRLLVAAKEGYCMTTNDLRDLPSCRRNFPGLPVLILANKQFLPESKELFMKSLLAEYTTTVLFYNPLPAADEKLAGEAVQQKRVYLASGHSVDDLEARSADKSPPGWIRRLYLEVQAANTDLPTTTNSA